MKTRNKYNFEIKRKIFHVCGMIIPLSYLVTSKIIMLSALLLITGITLSLDIARHYNPLIQKYVNMYLGFLLRSKEKSGSFHLSGASYMALGLILSCLIFPKYLAINTWLILMISDALAALIGKKYGKPLKNGKSIAGFLAFLISAIFISIIVNYFLKNEINVCIIVLASFSAALTEFYSEQIRINDNFLIPLSFGVVYLLLNLFIL